MTEEESKKIIKTHKDNTNRNHYRVKNKLHVAIDEAIKEKMEKVRATIKMD